MKILTEREVDEGIKKEKKYKRLLAETITQVLHKFVNEKRNTIPPLVWVEFCYLEHEELEQAQAIWNAILWRMIDGFERIANEKLIYSSLAMKKIPEEIEYENNTLEFFSRYFSSLILPFSEMAAQIEQKYKKLTIKKEQS